ncbi:hypothetical protein AMTRI_Chr02g255310 [Amborella trichopoda]
MYLCWILMPCFYFFIGHMHSFNNSIYKEQLYEFTHSGVLVTVLTNCHKQVEATFEFACVFLTMNRKWLSCYEAKLQLETRNYKFMVRIQKYLLLLVTDLCHGAEI